MSNFAARPPDEPRTSVRNAVEGIFDSSQQLLLDRIDLLQLEIHDTLRSLAKEAVMSLGASLLAMSAYIALSVAFGLFLTRFFDADLAALVVGLIYAVTSLAMALVVRAKRRADAREQPGEGAWTTRH